MTGLVPEPLVQSALAAIRQDLATRYDEGRQVEYDNRSYCPDLRGTSLITALVAASPVHGILDQALGIDRVHCDGGQIAVRKAHNRQSPFEPEPHLDGFATGLNGLSTGRIYSHTALIGIFLTPVLTSFSGNFTVWPGSHYAFENYFRNRGPRALKEPMPRPAIGNPLQLNCNPGDVVLAHYLLAHAAACNTSDSDRIAVFFRVSHHNLERNRWSHLTHLWEDWKI
jgi:hypothetical protein